MKPLPHGVCRNSLNPVSTRCPLRVEQLCFLSRRILTVRSPTILERRKTLSLKKIKFEATGYFFFSSPPRFLFLCFIHSSLLFFLFLFLFHFPVISSSHFSFFFSFIFSPFPPFWSIDRMGQKEEVSSPPSSSQMCGFPFSFLFFYFFIFLYDIIPYMA